MKILKAIYAVSVMAAIPVLLGLVGYYWVTFDIHASVDWKFVRFIYAVFVIPSAGIYNSYLDHCKATGQED